MSEAILVAVISGACTLLGSLAGVVATSTLRPTASRSWRSR